VSYLPTWYLANEQNLGKLGEKLLCESELTVGHNLSVGKSTSKSKSLWSKAFVKHLIHSESVRSGPAIGEGSSRGKL